MSFEYDVVVVGARVAGAPTAMLLSRMGHRVLVVDRVAMPSDTVSTHAMLRTGVLQMERWGLRDRVLESGAPPIRDITLGFGEERIRFEVRLEHGIGELYAPRRHVLDGILLEAALDSGAEFLPETRMVDLLRMDDGRVAGVEIETAGGRWQITARMVIGADGVSSRVAKLTGSATLRHHDPTNAVHYAYYQGVDHEGFWFQFTPGVNAGIIPTNDGLACVFAGRPRRLMPTFTSDPEAEFLRLLRQAGVDLLDRVSAASRVSPFRGTPGLPGFIRQPHGPGWALVGDAGYTKDPISAHGISGALRDAELCATAVDRALRTPGEEEQAMTDFQRTRDRLSSELFTESQALAGFEWGPVEASQRMKAISDAVRNECAFLSGLPALPSPAMV